MSRAAGWLGVTALMGAAAAGAALASTPVPVAPLATRSASVVPTTAADLGCPAVPLEAGATSEIVAVGAPGPAQRQADGTLTLRRLSSDTRPLPSTERAGRWQRISQPNPPAVAVGVSARDGLAPGAYAAAVTTPAARRSTGLAVTACEHPRDEWWFTGADTTVGSVARLVLANPTPAVAVADLTLYGPRGPVDAPGSRGIPIAPDSSVALDLARFAPGREALGVRVATERGRVTAAISMTRRNGLRYAGAEWVPPTRPPDSDLLVGAGPATPHAARLVVVNPGERSALVRVRVLGESGTFTPTGLESLRVGPGRTVARDLTDIPAAVGTALRLTSTVPVAAATMSEAASSRGDLAASPAGPALHQPAVVPLVDGYRTTLAFATVRGTGGTLVVRAYDDRGRRLGRFAVAVRGAATTAWPLPRSNASYLVVTVPARARISAMASYTGPGGSAVLPVTSGVWTVRRPAVAPAG